MKFVNSNFCGLYLFACLVSTCLLPISGSASAANAKTLVQTSGRLVNLKGDGVGNIPVYLWEQKGEISLAAKTRADGGFNFEHPICGTLTLEILPPLKTSYASALIDEVPGDQNRKLIVEMHQGHLISGHVVHDDKGLKGVLVRVKPVKLDKPDSQFDYSSLDRSEMIHGGGTTTTGKDGVFTLILTPGHKQLTVINNKHPGAKKKMEQTLTVRENQNIGALHL